MQQHFTFECGCGKQHQSTTTQTPPGWLIGRDGKPVCDDCACAQRARRQRRAA